MRKITAAFFSTLLLLGSASASDELDVIRTVRQFIDFFNKGDPKAALNTCAAQSAIIDEFPPYAWQGATGCADWLRDFDAYAKKNGITNPVAVWAGHMSMSPKDTLIWWCQPVSHLRRTESGFPSKV